MLGRMKKRGFFDMPVWLIWMLIALLVIIVILGLASGKLSGFLKIITNLFTPG